MNSGDWCGIIKKTTRGDMMKENKKIIQPELQINDGLMSFQDTIIQCCNISKISIEEKEVKPPFLLFFILMVSIAMFFIEDTLAIGFGGIIFTVIVGMISYSSNLNRDMFLIISLNSGNNVNLFSEDQDFLSAALKAIVESMKENKKVIINFNDCRIIDESKTEITVNNTIYQNDWSQLYDFFNDLEKKNKNSGFAEYCRQAKENANAKNKKGLKKLLEDNSDLFKNILSGVTSAAIIEIIKKITPIIF